MTIRVYGTLLLVLLLAACGRQLPEEEPVTNNSNTSSEVAAAPTETPTPTTAPTDTPATEEADTEETSEADNMDAEGDTDADAATDDETADAGGDDPVAAAIAAGNPEQGAQIFQTSYDTASGPWMCGSCHSVDANQVRLVGPGLWGLADRGAQRIAETGDDTIPEYVHNSIANPQAYIVPADEGGPYPENLMPHYADVLSEQEINDLVAYILTLSE